MAVNTQEDWYDCYTSMMHHAPMDTASVVASNYMIYLYYSLPLHVELSRHLSQSLSVVPPPIGQTPLILREGRILAIQNISFRQARIPRPAHHHLDISSQHDSTTFVREPPRSTCPPSDGLLLKESYTARQDSYLCNGDCDNNSSTPRSLNLPASIERR